MYVTVKEIIIFFGVPKKIPKSGVHHGPYITAGVLSFVLALF